MSWFIWVKPTKGAFGEKIKSISFMEPLAYCVPKWMIDNGDWGFYGAHRQLTSW